MKLNYYLYKYIEQIASELHKILP